MKNLCFIIANLFFLCFSAQKNPAQNGQIQKETSEYIPKKEAVSRESAQQYALKVAKLNNNYRQLTLLYKKYAAKTLLPSDKLKYADSAISSALKTKNNDIISDAYLGKATIYYFHFKQYRATLDELLKAYHYSEKTKNEYLKKEILYNLGNINSYLGYYDTALQNYEEVNQYFQHKPSGSDSETVFNYKKAYFSSLHQMIICHRKLGNNEQNEQLIPLSFAKIKNEKGFSQELGYFLKEKGIQQYQNKNYEEALETLQKSLSPMMNSGDFARTSISYLYIGKTLLALQRHEDAIVNFQKIDSIFQKHGFLFPELLESYELIINYYRNQKDIDKESFYIKQLLKANKNITQDFAYLSSTLHREINTSNLENKTESLKRNSTTLLWLVIILTMLAAILIILLIIKDKTERKSKMNYHLLEAKILDSLYKLPQAEPECHKEEDKCPLNKKMVKEILGKLKCFEESLGFTEHGITIQKLAQKLNSNSTYLSQVINEHKGVNFNRYLAELRIKYITHKLYTDKVFLTYKIESLADKCGIASRTNFSNLFTEINGVRPIDFIKRRQADIAEESAKNPINDKGSKSGRNASDHPNLSEED